MCFESETAPSCPYGRAIPAPLKVSIWAGVTGVCSLGVFGTEPPATPVCRRIRLDLEPGLEGAPRAVVVEVRAVVWR